MTDARLPTKTELDELTDKVIDLMYEDAEKVTNGLAGVWAEGDAALPTADEVVKSLKGEDK